MMKIEIDFSNSTKAEKIAEALRCISNRIEEDGYVSRKLTLEDGDGVLAVMERKFQI